MEHTIRKNSGGNTNRACAFIDRGGILCIAHLRTAGEINAFHRLIGGAIANNHLPEAGNMAKMISRCGFSIEINDIDDKYMIIARKL